MWEPLAADIPWVLVQAPNGVLVAYCDACGAQSGPLDDAGLAAFADAHTEHQSASTTHLGLGDAATPFFSAASRALGLGGHCTPCERRRMALNAAIPAVPFLRRR